MNPVFWLLVFLIAVLWWVAISILFKPLGTVINAIFETLKNNIEEDEED